jgi:glycosyltransferase involved in cell wall biosynthesis
VKGTLRVLWLKFGELLPVDTGGKLRSFHLLKELSRRVDLRFVSYYPAPMTPGYREELMQALPGSEAYEVDDMPRWREAALQPILLSALHGLPLNVSRFASRTVRNNLDAMIAREHFDVGVCDFLTPAWAFPRKPHFATVLFEHNVEWALWDRRAATVPWGPKRAFYRWETRRTRAIERDLIERFNATLAVSDGDREALRRLVPGADVHVVPTGVDVAAFLPTDESRRDARTVVFLGSMDWHPNVDGVRWFIDVVWPAVRAAVPGARFRVVGRRPPPEILALACDDVEITGDVPAVQPYLHEAAMSVVPLRAGGGTRLKIFEAMAAGAPVVSTTVGAEGLDVTPGEHLLIADEAEDFAAAIIGLLRDDGARRQLADRASRLVRAFEWSAVGERLEEILRLVVERKAQSERAA